MDPITMFGLVLVGLLVGVVIGMTSVGSGALLSPILLLDFGSVLSKVYVAGTASTYGTLVKIVGTLRNHFTHHEIKGSYAFMIAITGVPTAAIGAFYTNALISSNLFSPLLSVILIIAALSVILQLRIKSEMVRGMAPTTAYRHVKELRDPEVTRSLRLKGAFVGLYVGLIAGLTGVSTGTLLVTSLIVLLKFPPRTAVTLAIFEGGIILLAATATQIYLGHVSFLFVLLLSVGGVPGILIGGHFKRAINQRLLGYGVAGVIILESARTISQFLFGKNFFII